MTNFSTRFLLGALACTAFGASQAAVVYSNGASGDNHTGGGQRSIVNDGNATGWRYNNTTSGGSVGIDTTFARDGDGSVRLQGTQNSSRADIYYVAGTNAGANSNLGLTSNYNAHLGAFSAFDGFSFDWYRAGTVSGTPARANVAPTFRILLDRDGNLNTVSDRGELIFELVYQAGGFVAPLDQWVTSTGTGASYLHNTGLGLGTAYNINNSAYAYDGTLDEWQDLSQLSNAVILGFGITMGTGWGGAFLGAVDNVSWTINGVTTTTNFEVTRTADVPEPASLALVLMALAGLSVAGRARRRA